jgi:hypothetical protein
MTDDAIDRGQVIFLLYAQGGHYGLCGVRLFLLLHFFLVCCRASATSARVGRRLVKCHRRSGNWGKSCVAMRWWVYGGRCRAEKTRDDSH